nr:hypothetical protein Iba_chr04aCG18370 [Ipomoea batatas]
MEVPTEEEGQMQLATVPIQQKQAEFDKRILDLKKSLSSGNKEDEDNRLSSLFLKVDECQEEISTKFAKVIELKGDIRDAHENIFKQLTSLNDQQKDITKVLKYSTEKSTTGPTFGVIDYFREEQPKYTLNDAPPLIKKQPKKDQVAWVMKANTWMEEGAFQDVSNGFLKEYCEENPFKKPMDTTCLVKFKSSTKMPSLKENFKDVRDHINRRIEQEAKVKKIR